MFVEPGTYDEAITIFSPDGRLLQVEYAIEAVGRGATITGISCPEGVVLGAEDPAADSLLDPDFTWKICEVDRHLGAAVVGIGSDARILVSISRIYAQSNRLTYDEPIDVDIAARRIADLMQLYTQHAAVRPFGVSIIFGGVDSLGARLFTTDPSGSCKAYKAVAIGAGRETAQSILEKGYREDLTLREAIELSVECFVKTAKERAQKSVNRIAVVPSGTRRFRMLTLEEVKSYTRLPASTLK